MSLSYDKLMDECLLDLKMVSGTGTKLHDFAKPHHEPVTLTGAPAWVKEGDLNVLDFDPTNPDYIQIAAADSADLNFTTGDFSVAGWIYPAGGSYVVVGRGLLNTDGWQIWKGSNELIALFTYGPASVTSQSDNNSAPVNTWTFFIVTRSGTSARIYINGVDRTFTAGVHANPVTANRKLLVGIRNDETSVPFDGKMWRPRIWGKALTAAEIGLIWERERWLFGV